MEEKEVEEKKNRRYDGRERKRENGDREREWR